MWHGMSVVRICYNVLAMHQRQERAGIFIAQTATTSMTAEGAQPRVKDQRLRRGDAYLAGIPAVRAIIYCTRML